MYLNSFDEFIKDCSNITSDMQLQYECVSPSIIFSNTGRRGSVKYFSITLFQMINVLENMKLNIHTFLHHSNYIEKVWRDNFSKNISDPVINALSTVQTLPLYTTINKVIHIANGLLTYKEKSMDLSVNHLDVAIDYLKTQLPDETNYLASLKKASLLNKSITKQPFVIDSFITALLNANIILPKILPYRFVSALQTKPFVILTGLSGSGKTKLAEAFSLWVSETPDQYCMVSVGADWTNREPLLGFPNALETGKYVKPESGALDLILRAANDEKNKPYFLILDEMNMSHVERYFADFLSAMESTDGKISLHSASNDLAMDDGSLAVPNIFQLPKNLFIIGTVNIDETTYMFSPKVLDRANVIEFRVSEAEMNSFFIAPKELDMDALRSQGVAMGESFVQKSNEKGVITNNLSITLMPFFIKLQDAGAEFGYRSAAEISRFVKICGDLATGEMTADEVIDAAIIQKLLPKVHGSRNKIEKTLKELGSLCLDDKEKEAFQANDDKTDKYLVRYPLSYSKLKQMHKRVLSDGFTSFAEA